jgi:hypothetical protein
MAKNTKSKTKTKKSLKVPKADLSLHQQMLKGLPPGFANKPIVPTRYKKQIPGDDESGLIRNPDVPGDPVIDFPEYKETAPTVFKVERTVEPNGFQRNVLAIADMAKRLGGYVSPKMKGIIEAINKHEDKLSKTNAKEAKEASSSRSKAKSKKEKANEA